MGRLVRVRLRVRVGVGSGLELGLGLGLGLVNRRDLHSGGVAAAAAAAAAAAQPMAQQAHLRGVGEMKRRCSGDEGEIYKGDDGEI